MHFCRDSFLSKSLFLLLLPALESRRNAEHNVLLVERVSFFLSNKKEFRLGQKINRANLDSFYHQEKGHYPFLPDPRAFQPFSPAQNFSSFLFFHRKMGPKTESGKDRVSHVKK